MQIHYHRARNPAVLKSLALASTALVGLILPNVAQAQNWTGAVSKDWFNGGNWDGLVVPTVHDDTQIDTALPNPTEIDGAAAVSNDIAIGNNAIGVLTIKNGGTLADMRGILGNGAGSIGAFTVTGAGSTWNNPSALMAASYRVAGSNLIHPSIFGSHSSVMV